MENHKDWFDKITNRASGRSAAERSGESPATVNRQLKAGIISPDLVISLARGYGRSPVLALLETGYLLPEETGAPTLEEVANALTDQQLIAETARRIDSNPAHWQGTFSEVVDGEQDYDVRSNLYAVADNSDEDDGTVRDFDYAPEEYAADSSIDETEARLERGEDIID